MKLSPRKEGVAFWELFLSLLSTPHPKTPPACQETWSGQAFCHLAYARTSQGNNSAIERGNLGPGYFQPLLFFTQLMHYTDQ